MIDCHECRGETNPGGGLGGKALSGEYTVLSMRPLKMLPRAIRSGNAPIIEALLLRPTQEAYTPTPKGRCKFFGHCVFD